MDKGTVLGVFVGGEGRRFGGRDKSALPAPDGSGTLLQQHLRLARDLSLPCVLVGQRGTPSDDGDDLPPRLRDRPAGIGPLGGLCALLEHAGPRWAIALACDMPYVDGALIARLLAAPDAEVVAPRDPETGKWYPLCARYDAPRVAAAIATAAAEGVRSFQTCFRHLDVRELPLSDSERGRLRDWDRPEDVHTDTDPDTDPNTARP